MKIDGAIAFPHSLGLYYSGVTQYLGFPKFGDEYKVMGLAAYGQPEYLDVFRDIVRFDAESGEQRLSLGLDYFIHHRTGPEMSWADAGKTPMHGKTIFRRDAAAARSSARARRRRWSSGTGISRRRCRRGSKRFISAC